MISSRLIVDAIGRLTNKNTFFVSKNFCAHVSPQVKNTVAERQTAAMIKFYFRQRVKCTGLLVVYQL